VSIVLGTPFISGKDSLNNEFSYADREGNRRTIAIPPSLLISAIGQIDDVSQCVTMDLKRAGNFIYLIGETAEELGGSHFALVNQLSGGSVPSVNPEAAKRTFANLHVAIRSVLVRACHDLSEGGLAVAAAEMAFAGGLGMQLDLDSMPTKKSSIGEAALLFSESNSRFLCEVEPASAAAFEAAMSEIPCAKLGTVSSEPRLRVQLGDAELLDGNIRELKEAWQVPLRW
jgi:phosphoribosylformylglycinamidine synthase